MIKTIIFDIGGVVKKMNFKAIYLGFALRTGIPIDFVVNYHKEKFDDLLLGKISLEQFWQDMKNTSNKTDVSYEDVWVDETNKNTEINNELLLIIQKLRKKYSVGVLSNLTFSRLFTEERINLYSNFDYTVLSCKEHLKKPDPAFFNLALERASVISGEVIFIDDRKEFTDAAKKIGIKSIIYNFPNNDELLNNLRKLNINI